MKRWKVFKKNPACKGLLTEFLTRSKELDKEYFDKRRKIEADYTTKLNKVNKVVEKVQNEPK